MIGGIARLSKAGRRTRSALGVCLAVVLGTGSADAQRPARETIRALPGIDSAEQCSDGRCDRSVEERVFAVLDSLGTRFLARKMSMREVRDALGEPPGRYGPPLAFRDVRFGERITIWTYAVSLSGTYRYALVFVGPCLDHFGPAQASLVYARYGRPGWTSEHVEDYRVKPTGDTPCARQARSGPTEPRTEGGRRG